jgi:hypothetical protein
MPWEKTVVGVGERFAELEAVEEAAKKGKHRYMRCRCSCGQEKVVKLSHLRDGRIRSCGHLREAARGEGQPEAVPGATWIPVTGNNWMLVDELDAPLFAEHKLQMNAGYAYFHVRDGRWQYRAVPAHRLILGVADRPKSEVEVDHANGNRLDNRRENLRLCTRGENAKNIRGRALSGFKGVTVVKGQWKAVIQADRVIHRLGSFDTAEEAAQAYDDAAQRLHGEFARLNFPG